MLLYFLCFYFFSVYKPGNSIFSCYFSVVKERNYQHSIIKSKYNTDLTKYRFTSLLLLLLLLTAIGLMPGGSVYKDKVHEHPQYNTVHMSTIQVHEHYKTQERESTEKHRKYIKTHT
jgi:hypothetical protein